MQEKHNRILKGAFIMNEVAEKENSTLSQIIRKKYISR